MSKDTPVNLPASVRARLTPQVERQCADALHPRVPSALVPQGSRTEPLQLRKATHKGILRKYNGDSSETYD